MKRSKFSLSHYKLLSCYMGELIPLTWMEVLPGDTFQHATNLMLRVSPLLAPVMHPVNVTIHHWYVPLRIIWPGIEKFITGGPDGFDATVPPYFTLGTAETGDRAEGELLDYLGIDPEAPAGLQVSALPARAYNSIFNNFYRDQDLVTLLVNSEADGADTTSSRVKKNAAWQKDLFTSARPFTQKGPEVTIPLQGNAPVLGIGAANTTYGTGPFTLKESDGTDSVYATAKVISQASQNNEMWVQQQGTSGYPNIHADLSNVTAANINELRLAFALQRYEEARARYGSRYTEYLAYLGVRSSDARLQLPEYLGGGKQTISFSEVLQTAPGGDDQVGALKGHGINFTRSRRYRKFFEEHGIVMSLLCVRPITMYPQGIGREWNRTTKEMYFQRELQHIGQDQIFNKEVYAKHASPAGVFGYQDRYDEYRRKESSVAGAFRSTLDFWHMARLFATDPTLNASFVTSNPTMRIQAVQDEPNLWITSHHSVQARRMLARMGNSFIY